MSTVVAVVGTIAGAGTTTVATALASALGEQRRRVSLVDATAAGSRVTDTIDVDGDGVVTDALRRGTAVSDVQTEGPHDVAAFPAAPDTSWGAVRPDAVADLYAGLRERFEFVLVDAGNAPAVDRAAWLGHADEAMIVTDPDVAGAVPELQALASAFDVPVRGVLASRVPHKEVEDAIDALAATDQPVLGVLPEDPTVGAAAEAGASVLHAEPDSPIANCVWELALRFRGADHGEPVVPTGTAPSTIEGEESDSGRDGGSDAGSEPAAPAAGDDDSGRSEERIEGADASEGDGTSAEPGAEPGSERSADAEPEAAAPAEPGASGESGFVMADAKPVDAEEGSSVDDGSTETADDARDDAASEAPGGAASTAEPGEEDDPETAAGDDPLDGIGDLEVGLSDGASAPEADDAGTTSAGAGNRADADDRDQPENAESVSTDAAGDPRESRPGEGDPGSSGAPASEDDGEAAELSDEEIEAVFQETMERVQERHEREADDDE